MAIIEFEKIARSHSASNNVYFSVLKYINGTSNSLYLKKKKKKKKDWKHKEKARAVIQNLKYHFQPR